MTTVTFGREDFDTITQYEKVVDAFEEIGRELSTAMRGHPPQHSLHEAYGVIAEEFREFETEVFKNPRKHPDRNALARKEAIQVAAMAIRCLVDVL